MPLLIGILSSASTIPPTVIDDPYNHIMALDPIFYLRLNEGSEATTAINYGSAESADGTYVDVTSGEAPFLPASLGGSAVFDGEASTVSAPGVWAGVPLTGSVGVFVVWSGTGQQYVYRQWALNEGGFEMNIRDDTNVINFTALSTANVNDVTVTTTGDSFVSSGEVMLLGVTITETHVRIYVNGALYAEAARNDDVGSTENATLYLAHNESTSAYWEGAMSDFFITEQQLGEGEWSQIYARAMGLTTPAHDNWQNALDLDLEGGTETFNLADASAQPGETSIGANHSDTLEPNPAFARSVWAKITPEETGSFKFEGTSDDGNIILELYKAGDTFEEKEFMDSSLVGLDAFNETYDLEADTTYLLRIAAYRQKVATVDFEWSPLISSDNDDWVNAETIDVSSAGTVNGDVSAATLEDGEPDSSLKEQLMMANGTVWYKFVADATGTITFTNNIHGLSPIALSVDVYTGTAVNDLSRVTGTTLTPHDGHIDTDATASVSTGVTYYVQVTSYLPGTFTLAWSDIT